MRGPEQIAYNLSAPIRQVLLACPLGWHDRPWERCGLREHRTLSRRGLVRRFPRVPQWTMTHYDFLHVGKFTLTPLGLTVRGLIDTQGDSTWIAFPTFCESFDHSLDRRG